MKKTIVSLLLAAVLAVSVPAGEMYGSENQFNTGQEVNPAVDTLQEKAVDEPEENLDEEQEDTGEMPDSSSTDDSGKIPDEPVSDEQKEPASEENILIFEGEEGQEENLTESGEENTGDAGLESDGGSLNIPGDTEEQNEIPENFSGTIFTEENTDLLTAVSPEAEEVLEDIEEGRLLAFTAATIADSDQGKTDFLDAEAENAAVTALAPDRYKLYSTSTEVNCDEVWTADSPMHTKLRYIEYVDSDGKVIRSPLYCMKASKLGIDTDSNGIDLKAEAVRFFSNSTVNKLLYFGYGGPGDACGSFDPTCQHVDWAKWQNRYVFTHQALSKVYVNDVNGATEKQIIHVGLIRFIDKIKTMTIPNRSAVKIKSTNTQGNTVTGNPLNISMIYYRTKPSSGFSWLEASFKDGFQTTPLCTVVDAGGTGNGIRVSRENTASWQFVYWKSEEDARKNPEKPVNLQKGKSVTLKNGNCFRIIFSRGSRGIRRFSWKMALRPVKFILVDGSAQTGEDIQDFGACVYQGGRGVLNLNLALQPAGGFVLTKTSTQTGKPVQGAEYYLYAAQDLYSGGVKVHNKDSVISKAVTDKNGQILYNNNLVPGKYYIKEKNSPPGYLLNTKIVIFTVSAGKQTPVNVKDDPDIKGTVAIEKVVEGTDIHLSDAEFTLYTWNNASGKYQNGVILKYDKNQNHYVSETLVFNESNQGKFKVTETRNPTGYTGSWSREFQLTETGTNRRFTYRVENTPVKERRVEIRKQDSLNGMLLEGAEFHIYEWNQVSNAYKKEGVLLQYDKKSSIYKSDILKITDENLGKFRVEETKNPEGYQGTWSHEINLMDQDSNLQFTVKNDPIPKKEAAVHIRKMDAVTGELIEGAQFQAYAWDQKNGQYQDKPTAVFVYDRSKKLYICEKLEITEENQGRFRIKETKPPEGYRGSFEKDIKLTTNGQILELEVKNEPILLPPGEITVIKKIRESEIIWAHGNPTFSFVITGKDIRGNIRTYEDSVVFVPGCYKKDENGYAVMEVTVSDIPIGTYQIYEKQVLRYYLEKAQDNTANVSITAGKKPGYGIKPKDIAYGTAVLSITAPKASLTFYNKKHRYDGYSHNSFVENTVPIISSEEYTKK